MGAMTVLAVAMLVAALAMVSADGNCYTYYDQSAKYNLDPVATSYPWDEVKQAMGQNPMLTQVFAQSTQVPTSRPPGGHYYKPVSVVCPSQRFMLKAFKVDGKQCYVIKPEVQQVRYARCSDQYNRDCHYCSKSGMSKCGEDYEWYKVWAYCKPVVVVHPKPIHPVQPHPYPQPRVYPKQPIYPQQRRVQPRPAVVHPAVQPRYVQPTVYHADKLWAAAQPKGYYDPYSKSSAGRWKRSVPQYHVPGKVEQISLYLPYQCGCKTYQC